MKSCLFCPFLAVSLSCIRKHSRIYTQLRKTGLMKLRINCDAVSRYFSLSIVLVSIIILLFYKWIYHMLF